MIDKEPQNQDVPGPKWPEDAKQFLKEFYADKGAVTMEEKIVMLENELGKSNFDGSTGVHIPDSESEDLVIRNVEVTDENKLGGYEFELLEREGLIKPEYL